MPPNFKCNTNASKPDKQPRRRTAARKFVKEEMVGKVDEIPGGCWGLIKKVALLQIARDRNRNCKSRRDAYHIHREVRKIEQNNEEGGNEHGPGRSAGSIWIDPPTGDRNFQLPSRSNLSSRYEPLAAARRLGGWGALGLGCLGGDGGDDPVKRRVVTWWCGDMWGREDGWPGG